jgi:pyruvate/2-oxoglutarate dehydrogenase complex dihydrolipoamide dehydrogenase (E3) component
MSVDYDLVVIGQSPEGIYAAEKAIHLKARVALVEQPFPSILEASEETFSRILSYFSENLDKATQLGIYQPISDLTVNVKAIQGLTKEVMNWLAEKNSPAKLSALGVDFIKGSGEFVRLPQQAFVVGNRRLRSRAYLIATGCHTAIFAREELSTVGYLTPDDIWQENCLESLPQVLAIISSNARGIILAQILKKLGKNVILIAENSGILPTEDVDVSRTIQAQLEAEGIRVLTNISISQLRKIEDKKWLQVGNQAIEVDEIIIADQYQPNIEGLNLEGVGVELQQNRLIVNHKLQTTNPIIYACGSSSSESYIFSNIARYEAKIALKNALFFPWFKANYRFLPYPIPTYPQLARVGLTESQAIEHYGDKILVTKEYFKMLSKAQFLGETTGFLKLITHRNGEILGTHIVGMEAGEIINAIALAMKQKIKIQELSDLFFPDSTISEIIQHTSLQWQQQQFNRQKSLQNFLENFFIWRRNWSS